ncbi:hypothetical protein S40288_08188 [Stachybotrys chartarum IBT 40288]|nr:hypothetical protein S40288_08188 [Stachybotrys chartarum IBT 40288]
MASASASMAAPALVTEKRPRSEADDGEVSRPDQKRAKRPTEHAGPKDYQESAESSMPKSTEVALGTTVEQDSKPPSERGNHPQEDPDELEDSDADTAVDRQADASNHQPARKKKKKKKKKTNKPPKSQIDFRTARSGADPDSGQKPVFNHSTSIPHGEEDEFEPDADAMAYLKSVSLEAQQLPRVVTAVKPQAIPATQSNRETPIGPQLPADLLEQFSTEEQYDDDSDDVGDAYGFFEDGAYIGRSRTLDEDEESDTEEEKGVKALHEAYYAAILGHYQHMRSVLGKVPPSTAVDRFWASSSSLPTECTPLTHNIWSRLLRDSDPSPLWLVLLDKTSVLEIIRLLVSGKFLHRGQIIPERISRWLWALLARLPDRGTLNHFEAGRVRDLGNRAALLAQSLADMAALGVDLAEGPALHEDGVDRAGEDERMVNGNAAESDDPKQSAAAASKPCSGGAASPPFPTSRASDAKANQEEEDDDDVAMDLGSDSDLEEGEVEDDGNDAILSLEDAKARLLAQLDDQPGADADDASEVVSEEEAAKLQAQVNTRATITMILTVVGEFYGQRDLLEARRPFVGM